jgi:hypothetical protein
VIEFDVSIIESNVPIFLKLMLSQRNALTYLGDENHMAEYEKLMKS